VSLESRQKVNCELNLVNFQEVRDGKVLLWESHDGVHRNVLRKHFVDLLRDDTPNAGIISPTNLLPLLRVLVRLHSQFHQPVGDLIVVNRLNVLLDALI